MRAAATVFFVCLIFALLTSATRAGDPEQSPAVKQGKITFPLIDLQGTPHAIDQNDERRVRVFVFLGTECPVSNGYVPTLNALRERVKDKPVDLFGVVSDRLIDRAAAKKHFADFEASFPVLFDASGLLQTVLAPTHMPEAFVVDPSGELIYRGAIDNAWEALGRRRPKAEKHYVADAIDAALANDKPPVVFVQPIGCRIEPHHRSAKSNKVTFTRDIAPIVFSRCTNCHRTGQVAPFALETFEQVVAHAEQIVEVTRSRIMPPWIPLPGEHKFVGERSLTAREIELFSGWKEAGCPQGLEADLPPRPQFTEGWRLGKPDLIVKMAEPFAVPADGPDLLQNFVIPIDIASDQLVAAVEFHPGNARVTHHAVLFLDDSGAARKRDLATPEPGYANFGGPGFLPSGALGGWSVGNTPRALPNGMGRYLKKGSDLVLQMHYHPTGRRETDQSEIGLYFVKKPVAESLKEKGKLVGSIWLSNYELDIAAGEKRYERTATYVLPKEVTLVGVVPHMHLLGRAMKVTATLPKGEERTLIEIDNWNYNWQDEYYYERPFKLPTGTTLKVTAAFDNSADNPSNPSSPPRRVTWGDGTTDEMLYCFFLLSADRTEDLIHVIFDNLRHDTLQPRKK